MCECPHCGGRVCVDDVISEHQHPPRVWSDGRVVVSPFETAPVQGCPWCGRAVWVAAAARVDTPSQAEVPGRFLSEALYPSFVDLDADGYLDALDRGEAVTDAQARTLRTLAWWSANDPHRRPDAEGDADAGGEASAERERVLRTGEHTPRMAESLEVLARQLGDDVGDRVTRAEICRELGRFDAAERLLALPVPAGCARTVDRLRDLAGRGVSRVAVLPSAPADLLAWADVHRRAGRFDVARGLLRTWPGRADAARWEALRARLDAGDAERPLEGG